MAEPAEPPEKKQKTEEEEKKDVAMGDAEAPKEEQPKVPEPPEPPKELEKDAPKDKSPVIKDTVAFLTPDTTVNLLPAATGNVLMGLSDGGFQYFLAGARASVGVKSGRYMFEARIMEYVDPAEDNRQSHGRRPYPKQLLKVGFSTCGSSLLLGDGDSNVCFDSEGSYAREKTVSRVCQRFARDTVVGVLLNLDSKSENFNTISLFLDGVRACQPQVLPESLEGKVLYPTVSFRNVTVHVNFGSQPMAPLPFTCKMIQDAATKDSSVTKPEVPKDGKYEVIFPVCLPDEGSFDWLDDFLEKNPHYVELSDRAILKWAEGSGIFRPKGYNFSTMDKPGWEFGIPLLDDFSVRTVLKQVAPIQPRHFVVMEVKGNLIKEDREALLPVWNSPMFKPIAHVVVGEPNADFKYLSREKILKDKQTAADNLWKAQKLEEKRKKQIEKQAREAEKAKKKAEKERIKQEKKEAARKKKAAEAAAKAEAEAAAKAEADAKAAAEAKEKADREAKEKAEKEAQEKADNDAKEKPDDKEKDGGFMKDVLQETQAMVKMLASDDKDEGNKGEAKAEKKEEDVKMEDVKAEVKAEDDVKMVAKEEDKEEEKQEDEEEEDEDEEKDEEEEVPEEPEVEEEPPKVELTDEESKAWYHVGVPDLTPWTMNTNFSKFSLPEKEEGFHDIRYEWTKGTKANDYLKAYKLEKKITMRVEDLVPSEWFHIKCNAFQKTNQAWHAKQNEWKANLARRAADASAKAKKKTEVEAAAKAKAEVEAKTPEAKDAEETKSGDAGKKDVEAENKTEDEAKPMDVDEKKEEEMVPDEDEVDFDGMDVFAVEDVCNIGGGVPLFKDFFFEDWTMATLRYELYLLVQAFRKDCGDPERAGIHVDNVPFYYNKYYKKGLRPDYFGVNNVTSLVNLVKDAVYVTKQKVLDTQLPVELETFGIFIKLAEEARRYRMLRLDLGEESARLRISQQPSDYHHQKGGGYHSYGKGGKRDYKGDNKRGDYNKGYDRGRYQQPVQHVVPYQTPPPPAYRSDPKGQQKGYDRGYPPPPPQYSTGYAPPMGKDMRGKDAKGKDKDGKGKYDYGKGSYDKGGKGGSTPQYAQHTPPPPPPQSKGYDKGGYGKDNKGGHYDSKGGYGKDNKGGKDGKKDNKGGYDKSGYGQSNYDKGGYGKGGYGKDKDKGKDFKGYGGR